MALSEAFVSGLSALARNEAVRLGAQQVLQRFYDRTTRRDERGAVPDITSTASASVSREDLLEAVAAVHVQTEAGLRQTRAEIAADNRLALRPLYAVGAVILLLQVVLIVLLAR